MKELKYAIVIFVAILAWQFTLAVLLGWLLIWAAYSVVRAIYKNHRKRVRNSKLDAVVPQIRTSLRKDRLFLMTIMVGVIRQHWNILEDKFEQYVDEDDYGNVFVDKGLKQEFVYFSEKVVLPELLNRINNGKTNNKDLAFILQDATSILQHINPVYFGIKFEDSDQVIARKLLLATGESTMSDELLYNMRANQAVMDSYLSQTQAIFMRSPSITLNFSEKLKTSESITVSPFVGLVFTLFSAMHNTKKDTHDPKKYPLSSIFTGNDPYKYEEFVKELLRTEGFRAKRTRGSGDYGVDVIASKNGKTYAIQCKLYNHTVGTKAVQEIVSGRIFYGTDFAIVVSDNSFTDAAKTLARKSDVILTHHKNLLHKIQSLDANNNEPHDTDELLTVILPTIRNN